MNSSRPPQLPVIFDISRIPADFGSGRLKDLIVTFDNLDIGSYLAREGERYPIKNESFFTILLLKGSIQLLVNLREVEVHEGQRLSLMPGCVFQVKDISKDLLFCGMILDKDFVEKMRKNVGVHLDLTQKYRNFVINTQSPSVMENDLQMYRLLCSELATPSYSYKTEVIQRYCEVAVLKSISLNDMADKPELSRPLNRKEQIFHDFLTLLEEYYTQERSISFYADRMCLTPKYLSTIVKEVSGKHGMQWIDEYVLLEAKALLRDGSISVKEVSDQLNFPSQSMFGRFFKKMTGLSPKQYKLK